jgi:hypothetical protein
MQQAIRDHCEVM